MKIAIDVDGVLAHFFKSVCKKYNQVYVDKITTWDIPFINENWNDIQNDLELWDNLPVLNEVDFDFHCYLTSIPIHLKDSRINWLKRNGFPDKPVHISNNKAGVARKYGLDILIDDKPDNIRDWLKTGRPAIQYIPYYADLPIESKYSTDSFKEIKHIINKIKNEREKNSKLQFS